jgi:uncharacterized protein (TIGR00730 family)
MTEPPADERQRSLPGEHPKSVHDDPNSADALARILASASYREAAEDLGFLNEDLTRGLRLQLEYLKAETLLRQHDIRHTVVVFGSARVAEPQAARRRLDAASTAAAAHPDDAEAQQQLAAAKRLVEISHYYEVARDFGRLVGRTGTNRGAGCTCIMTGGGPGIMEAANRGAHDAGALSIGLNITLPREQFPNPYVTPELALRFRYFAMRKFHFALRARALVVFPGGYGTMDELFEILELSQTRKMPPVPVVLVGERFWRRAFDPDFLLEQGMVDPEDLELFMFAETADAIWHSILDWHSKRGEPLPCTRV